MADFRVEAYRNIPRAPLPSGVSFVSSKLRTSRANRPQKPAGSDAVFEIKPIPRESGPAGKTVLTAANKYLGIRYEMGGGRGSGPPRSLDCSSFAARVYSDATGGRVKLTPYTDSMYKETVPVSPAEAQPGDLVFYKFNDPGQPGTRFPHVAIYAGNGQVVDASSTTGRVSYHPIRMGNYIHEFRRAKAPE